MKTESLEAEQSLVCAKGRGLTTHREATGVNVSTEDWSGTRGFLVAEISQELLLGFDFWRENGRCWDFVKRENTLRADRARAKEETPPAEDLPAPATADPEDLV